MRASRRLVSSTLLALGLMGSMVLAGCTPGNGGANDSKGATSATPAEGSSTSSSSNSSSANSSSANSSSAVADSGPKIGNVSTEQARTLIESASHGNAHLDHIFAGPSGMIGAITTDANGGKSVVFLSSDAKIVFPSGGFTSDGENINKEYLTSQKVYTSASDLAKEVVDKGFIIGTKGPIVTVWQDPNCYWCHKFFENFSPELDAGRMRMRILLVGVIKPDSMDKSVSILLAKDKWKALKEDELKFNEKTEEGGASIPKEKHPDLEALITSHAQMMSKAGPVSTPGLLFCTKGSSTPTYQNGSPQDVKSFMATLSSDGVACGGK